MGKRTIEVEGVRREGGERERGKEGEIRNHITSCLDSSLCSRALHLLCQGSNFHRLLIWTISV